MMTSRQTKGRLVLVHFCTQAKRERRRLRQTKNVCEFIATFEIA